MRPSSSLVIDVGASHVAAGLFAPGAAGRLVLEDFASASHSAEPALDSGWMTRTAGALAALPIARKWRGPVVLAVPGHLTLTKFIRVPRVAEGLREQVVRFEAAQSLPFPLDDLAWDHGVVTEAEQDSEVMLTAVKLAVMEDFCAAVDAAGLKPRRASASVTALHRAFRFNHPAPTVPVLVVDIGARTTNVLVVGPAGGCFARTLLLGGNTVTAAVAEALRLDFAGAEALKLQVARAGVGLAAEPARAEVERAVADFAGGLQREIVRTIGSFGWRTGTGAPVGLYLTGGAALMPGLDAALAVNLKMPMLRYDALRNVDLSNTARAAGAAGAQHLLPNLVGLAAAAIREPSSGSGLLPPAVRAARTARRRQQVLVCAGALLATAMLPPICHFHRLAGSDRARAEALGAQLPPMRALAERNAADLARLATTQRQIGHARRAVRAKSSWIEFLGDLETRLGKVGDVWLEKLAWVPPVAPLKPEGPGRVSLPTAPGRLRLGGRMFDAANPLAKVGQESYARVQALLASLTASPFVSAVGDEHFDYSQPGILRFDVTLTVNPERPL